jgi:hypothetical protein
MVLRRYAMKIIRIAFGFLFICFSLAPIASAGNLINNPGFETGDFTDWTITGETTYDVPPVVTVYGIDHCGFGCTVNLFHSGYYGAWFGSVENPTYMTQTIATVPGASYDLSAWVMMYDNISEEDEWDNEFRIWWNGSELLQITPFVFPLIDSDPFNYGFGGFNGLVAEFATTDVTFGFRNPNGFWAIDDISVTPSAVPEPSSILLLCTGLSVLGLVVRRKK